ncbi:MAG TPA: tetratricopeptide repeat protein [Bryobacteraceae bacterium]|nr:tetratricopeptide repeat protein [Bryobacteraceae bacterium]
MVPPSAQPAVNDEFEVKARQQLARILASRTFQQADRLKRFISFIVEETIAGRGNQLKEFLLGMEVFGKDSRFDPRTDPLVRVQARRLRVRLARYYTDEGQDDEILIELPKGGYAPVIKRNQPSPKRASSAALMGRNQVVVFPFTDYTPQRDQEFFCKGIREEIIVKLMRLNNLRVVSHAGGAAAEGAVDSHDAAERLNAAVLIIGSIRKSQDDYRITTHLVDGESGRYLSSVSIDRHLDDVFGIQEEVAEAVAEKLASGMPTAWHSRGQRTTGNLAAYNLCLQGRYHMGQRTEEGLRLAIECFERAIVEDEQCVEGFCGLADANGLLGHYGIVSPAEVWTKTASNAAWAVQLDANSAEAHTSLAHVKATQDWDWLAAQREFQRAIQLDARYPTAHHWYAMSCLAPLGKLEEALEEIQTAQALDPISSIVSRDRAIICYYLREFEWALEQCDHTIESNPHFSPAYWALGLIQEQRGDFDESAAAFERAIQLSPNSPRMRGALGRTLALAGKKKEALQILNELHDLAAKRYVSPFELASVHFALGQVEPGFEWLTRAYQDRCYEMVSVRVDPRFDSLRGHPLFTSLSGKLGVE